MKQVLFHYKKAGVRNLNTDVVTYKDIKNAADYMKRQINNIPDTAIVLGSGLGHMADIVKNPVFVDYSEIPDFPRSTVEGHRGRFVCGEITGKNVLLMQGRVHYYEGYSMDQVVMPVRMMGLLGVKNLILTNASGGIADKLDVGDIMVIEDHISSFVRSPLIYEDYDRFGVRFPDMTHVYDPEIIKKIKDCYSSLDISCKSGVYIQVTGPQYETPAEIQMYKRLGADAIGMSTVCEAIAARHMGMRVAALSSVCNKAAGLGGELSHSDIIKAGDTAADKLQRIICKLLTCI